MSATTPSNPATMPTTTPPTAPTRALAAACLVLLAIVCMGVFGRVIGHTMLQWDDRYHVADNPWFAKIDGESFAHFWRAPYGNLYIPVAYNFFALEVAATHAMMGEARTDRLDPMFLHAVKVALHAANASLVFLLLRRIVRATGAALLGALLFALHPLQVESVAWISETRGLLAAMFGLAAVLALWRAVAASAPAAPRQAEPGAGVQPPGLSLHVANPIRAAWYVLGVALFALALLSKPSAVTMPIVAAAALWAGRVPLGRSVVAVVPWLLMSIAAVMITQRVQEAAVLGAAPALWQRPLVAADAICFYAANLTWPASLAPDYGRTPAQVLQGWWPWLALAIVLGAGALIVWAGRLSRAVPAAAAIGIGSLLPVLGFATFHHQAISTVADRYMYIALVGAGLLVAAGLAQVRSRTAWIAGLAVAAGLGAVSFSQSGHWETDETLWRHNVAVVAHSPVAHNNLGRELQRRNRNAEAEPLLVRALELDPASATTMVNLAELRGAQGRRGEAEDLYRRALEVAPGSARAAVSMGVLLAQSGRGDEAKAMFARALEADPRNAEAMNNLGVMLLNEGDSTGAARLLERVVERDPEHTEALFNLALVYAQAGRWVAAGELWGRSAEAGMSGMDVRMRAADAFARGNDYERAEVWYGEAAAAEPMAYEPHNNLGLLYIRLQRYYDAAHAFERAVERAPDAPEPRENLRNAQRLLGR